jgi:hypothetical protein
MLFYECSTEQLHKRGEELCGDSVAVSRRGQAMTFTLSDGLGSGVKANILATLTTRIATHLLENDLPVDEVVETLSETLPVCETRKLAYSTFAIGRFAVDGLARIAVFDSPPMIHLRGRRLQDPAYSERSLEGKNVRETVVQLEAGDWIVFVSDGVLNAGIGGSYPLGWGWDQTARFIETQAHPNVGAEELAQKVATTVGELYDGAPGDDVTVAVIKVRQKLVGTILTGPPSDRARDKEVTHRFMSAGGRHAVCGGTTAKILARELARPLQVDLETGTDEVPPQGHIDGIEVVTEGILTLTRAAKLLSTGTQKRDLRFVTDGAAALARFCLSVDQVAFLVGQAVNPAHQNPSLPGQLAIRYAVVRELAEELRRRNIEVTLERV